MLTTNHQPTARAETCACGVPVPPGREMCSACAAEWARIDHVEHVRPLLEDAIVGALQEAPLLFVATEVVVRMAFAARVGGR